MSKLITDNLQTLDGAFQTPVADIVQAVTAIMGLPDSSDVTKGDALIAVKLPVTGAVARTQHDHNKQVVYLEDFGAVGDGVTDDTLSIQKALDSGAIYITQSSLQKKFYKITNSLLMKTDHQVLDIKNSELDMQDATLNKSHIIVGNTFQMNRPVIKNCVFTNKGISTAYQIQINNVGAFVVENSVGYGSAGNAAQGFIDVTRAIVGYIRNNTTEGLLGSALRFKGTDNAANRCVDVAVYDNRFVGGVNAASYGDYCEGIFFRRNICYAQTEWQLLISAASPATGLLSAKIQENDFDSPTLQKGGVYIQNFKNVQIVGNWFANNSVDPMIQIATGTDSIIVSDNQAYPASNFLTTNGANTVVTNNMVIGGTTQIYFGSSANLTTVSGNHLTVASGSCIDTNGHTGSLTVTGNTLQAAGVNGGLAAPASTPAGHKYLNNTGDIGVGSSSNVTMTGSPFTYTVGPRPEIIALKGGTITDVSVNSAQMATASNITLGPLPPGAVVQVSYSGATPGFTALRVL